MKHFSLLKAASPFTEKRTCNYLSQRRPAFRQNESTFSALGIQFILLNCCLSKFTGTSDSPFIRDQQRIQLRYKINSCYTKFYHRLTILLVSPISIDDQRFHKPAISSLFLYKNQICFFDCQSVVHLLQDELAFTDLLPVHRTHLFHIPVGKTNCQSDRSLRIALSKSSIHHFNSFACNGLLPCNSKSTIFKKKPPQSFHTGS